MTVDVVFEEKDAVLEADFENTEEMLEATMGEVQTIHAGQNGATFIPSVSADGIISWTNDRELENPKPVNIKGDIGKDGYTPIKGIDYFDGKDGSDGYTPVKGKDYFDGKDGKDGVDGKTPVKGVDYFDGSNGVDGADGFSPVVSVEDIEGGHRVTITDKDGAKSFDVMDGTDGAGGGGGSADWNVNDPDAVGYVKNRTHWVENAFEPIVWDGSTEGRDSVDVSSFFGYPTGSIIIYKISDEVLTAEQIKVGTVFTTIGRETATAEVVDWETLLSGSIYQVRYASFADNGYGNLEDFADGVLFVAGIAGDFTESYGVVIPSVGVYALPPDDHHELRIQDIQYHTLDPKFIPDSVRNEVVVIDYSHTEIPIGKSCDFNFHQADFLSKTDFRFKLSIGFPNGITQGYVALRFTKDEAGVGYASAILSNGTLSGSEIIVVNAVLTGTNISIGAQLITGG